MKLGGIPETPIERIGSALGLLPQPLLDTHVAMLLARAIMEGTRLGVFEALKDGPLPAEEVAARCGCDPKAMRKLLDALAGCEYLRWDAGRYSLAPVARKWLLASSPQTLRDKMLWQLREWDYIARLGDFVRSGRPLDLHPALSTEDWRLYQRGMRAVAVTWVPEAARRIPVPKGARDLLDIGG